MSLDFSRVTRQDLRGNITRYRRGRKSGRDRDRARVAANFSRFGQLLWIVLGGIPWTKIVKQKPRVRHRGEERNRPNLGMGVGIWDMGIGNWGLGGLVMNRR